MALTLKRKVTEIQDPPLARFLFGSTQVALLWLAVRLYLGYQWFGSGWGKLTNPKWVETGEALQAYWANAVKIPAQGKPPVTFDWYRGFLQLLLDTQSYTWFAKLIAAGEVLIAVALILGLFTGIAAFFGGFMNWNFMMAGSASSNPWLFVLSIGLILAWKTAGYYGADRLVLPLLGTPWQLGGLFRRDVVAADAARVAVPAGA
jgi:thiosulfate dehydrogenase (quinone) large subunit